MRKQNDNYADFVKHPRYGKGPHDTGLNPESNSDNKVGLLWHSRGKCRIPNTALKASRIRQSPSFRYVTHYFDVIRLCLDCGRNFIFFAQEQRHWYEVLRFDLSANCRHCVECRKSRQKTAGMRMRHDYLLGLENRSEKETLELIDCGITLAELDVFGTRIVERIRQLLNKIPDDSKTRKHATFRDLMARSEKLMKKRRITNG